MQRAPGCVPRDDRAPVSLTGTATLSDGRVIDLSLTNLSRDGCQVQSDELLRIGEQLLLNVSPIDEVVATVRWSLFGTAGLRFATRICA